MPIDRTIRPATLADEAAVVALWQACGLVMPYNDPVADFRFARGKPGSDILVGVDSNNRIVGTAMVGHDGHRGWVYYVAADPTLRKQGIGREMMHAAEEWQRQQGVQKMMLLVREANTQAVDFYSRLGYEVAPRAVMMKNLGA
jgi:ribosomal protein S18 acetylase RimI-like enzyme